MKNDPHNTNMAPRLRTPTPEPEDKGNYLSSFTPWSQIKEHSRIKKQEGNIFQGRLQEKDLGKTKADMQS